MSLDPKQIVHDNVRRIRARIATAADRAGRSADEIQLVAVTKYVDSVTASHLLGAGCDHLGESRPQQLWEKAAAPELASAVWHLVGHLQRNKVRRTLPLVSLIHSVDSARLLESIDHEAARLQHSVKVLLELHCSHDEAKHGLSEAEAVQLIEKLDAFEHVRVGGVMTMASREGGSEQARRDFARLREMRQRLLQHCPPGIELREMSMGMSGDFEQAIAEGATIVRIGSAFFEGLHD